MRRTSFKLTLVALVALTGAVGFGSAYAVVSSKRAVQASAGCQSICVRLGSDGAVPDILTVPTGGTVEFQPVDGKKHKLILVGHDHSAGGAHQERGYDSGDIGADEAWRLEFKQDGKYTFADEYDPKIHIDVVAYTLGGDYKIR